MILQALGDGDETRRRAELTDFLWSLPRKTLAPEGLASEEDIHVAPEGVAEHLCLFMLMWEHVIIVRVSGGGSRGSP
jgi:hypothetical protein